ncbi:MAG: sigma-70 family RNA polymerase sigma factor [Clostridia bacterium]|nr:sigma-70 family RNA polymerase sigma factor [Clostridia bacterium]
MTNPTMEQAVEQNYDDILWYFVYRVRNRAAAEDLTQETFYRFLRYSAGTARFRTPQKCRAYLFTIASNVCRDYYAKSADAAAELDENLPAEETDDRELSAVIENALTKLPDAQREAAVLYYYSGFKVREIAAIQGATVTAVKSRLKMARDALKIILGEEGFS